MNKLHGPAYALALALTASCGDGSTTSTTDTGAPPAAELHLTATGLEIKVNPYRIPPGEMQRCVVLAGLEQEMVVRTSDVHQTPGGHHVALFTSPNAHPGDVYDCTAVDTLANSRFLSPGVFDGTGENLAYRIPAGKPFIVQSHYVNASLGELEVQDTFTAQAVPAGTTPKLIDFLALTDAGMLVPMGVSSLTTTCTFPRDMKIIQQFGHMHEMGQHYRLEKVANGNTTVLDEYEWEVDYRDTAPIRQFSEAAPMLMRAGETLRVTCTWNNVRDHAVEFPEEMCVSFMQYLVDANWNTTFLVCTNGQPNEVR